MKLTPTKPLTLRLPSYEFVRLSLVGCGGTGSHIASGLASIALALAEKNIRLDMRFIDGDRVEPQNVGRQLFSGADVGKAKAVVLADRLNRSYGLTVSAFDRMLEPHWIAPQTDRFLNIVVGAVDNPAARAIIAKEVEKAKGRLWWLDCGNDKHSGQVLLGNVMDKKRLAKAPALGFIDCLPAPTLLYPDLVATPKIHPKGERVKRSKAPSCAELTAAGEQGLMVNRMAAAWACSMLDELLLGTVKYFGVAFDLGQGGTKTWALDEETVKGVEK